VNALVRAYSIVSHNSQESVSHILVFWLRCSFLIVFRLDLKSLAIFSLWLREYALSGCFHERAAQAHSLTTYSSFGSGALFYCFLIRSQVANGLQFNRDVPQSWIKY